VRNPAPGNASYIAHNSSRDDAANKDLDCLRSCAAPAAVPLSFPAEDSRLSYAAQHCEAQCKPPTLNRFQLPELQLVGSVKFRLTSVMNWHKASMQQTEEEISDDSDRLLFCALDGCR
jgi:hypothetical protein